jgi:U4/U6 small nuclear ribonucleoprotein PRP31
MAMQNSSKFSIPTLRRSEWYRKCTDEVRNALHVRKADEDEDEDGDQKKLLENQLWLTSDLGNEHSAAYKLMVESSRALREMEDAMGKTLTFIKGLYRARFPELEELVPNKVDYVRCAQRIGNETDMSKVKLSDILPSNTVMIVNVTGTMTSGTPLEPESLSLFNDACSEMLALSDDRGVVLLFLESRMDSLAPNLSVLIGAQVAATLIALAGTLTALSKIPGCNIEVMGHDQRTLQGLSMASSTSQYGALINAPLVQSAPRSLRRKMIKVLSGKVALMARVDAYRTGTESDAQGRRVLEELTAKLAKWQEPEKARTKKALPVPDEAKKKKRGGKRARKLKERMAQTELAAQRNRVSFTVGENSEYGDSAMGVDMGMVGRKDSSKLRRPVEQKKPQLQLSKKARKALSSSTAAAAGTDGLATSLAFTDSKGIDLPPPPSTASKAAGAEGAGGGTSIFSSTSGFKV